MAQSICRPSMHQYGCGATAFDGWGGEGSVAPAGRPGGISASRGRFRAMIRATVRLEISGVAPRLPRRNPPASGGRFGRWETRRMSGLPPRDPGIARRPGHRPEPTEAALVPAWRSERHDWPARVRALWRCGIGPPGERAVRRYRTAHPQACGRLLLAGRLALVGQEPRQCSIRKAGGERLQPVHLLAHGRAAPRRSSLGALAVTGRQEPAPALLPETARQRADGSGGRLGVMRALRGRPLAKEHEWTHDFIAPWHGVDNPQTSLPKLLRGCHGRPFTRVVW